MNLIWLLVAAGACKEAVLALGRLSAEEAWRAADHDWRDWALLSDGDGYGDGYGDGFGSGSGYGGGFGSGEGDDGFGYGSGWVEIDFGDGVIVRSKEEARDLLRREAEKLAA